MRWRQHFGLEGKHAFLSPSNGAWTNYDRDKLRQRLETVKAAQRGTEFHELAHRLIKLGEPLRDLQRTLNMYVNDALTYKMQSEVMLYYSPNCFGTADTLSFRDNLLRVHDLKTGISRVSERQLEIYAALFCLEYGHSPFEIDIELRIYKDNKIQRYEGDAERMRLIRRYMDIIVEHDKEIELWRLEGEA